MCETKKCSRCGKVKELSDFNDRKENKDGKHIYCKCCVKKCREEKKEYNKQHVHEYQKDIKICTKCGKTKSIDEFHNSNSTKDGKSDICKECNKDNNKKYYDEHVEYYEEHNRIYNSEHEEQIKESSKKYYWNNKEKINTFSLEYSRNHKERVNETARVYTLKKRHENPLFKLGKNIANNISSSLKAKRVIKRKKTVEILGCSIPEFKKHIESQFEDWMSWDNYGGYNNGLNQTWDIDHILPVSSATTEEELLKLNHYTNLQPLCSYINRYIKRDRLDYIKE